MKDVSGSQDALTRPSSASKLWNDHGSRSDYDVQVYKLVPQPGYTCLGAIAMSSYSIWPDLDKYACVKNEYLSTVEFTSSIWNDIGSGYKSIYC